MAAWQAFDFDAWPAFQFELLAHGQSDRQRFWSETDSGTWYCKELQIRGPPQLDHQGACSSSQGVGVRVPGKASELWQRKSAWHLSGRWWQRARRTPLAVWEGAPPLPRKKLCLNRPRHRRLPRSRETRCRDRGARNVLLIARCVGLQWTGTTPRNCDSSAASHRCQPAK
jgi:hypothetical protein